MAGGTIKLKNKYKSILYAIPLLVGVGLAVLVYQGLILPVPYQPVVKVNKPVPVDMGMVQTPALINVFASWCYECVLEMPILVKLSSSVPVYGLNYWDENATAWLEKHGNPYTTFVDDPQGIIASQMAVIGVPETFLVDKDGIIRIKIIGQVTGDLVERVLIPWMERNGIAKPDW